MNTLELITKAYYLSGVSSRGYQVISDEQIADGLDILNDILAEKSMTTACIPYYSHTTFNAIPGQSIYDIPGLVDITQFTFNIENVRYSMISDSQQKFFGDARVDNIKNLPFHYYAERQLVGMRLYLYFTPNQDYEMNITGKYELQELALFDNISLILNRFYISYLKYYLAKRLCDFNGRSYPPNLESTYIGLNAQISNMFGVDLSVVKNSMFTRDSFNWGQINIGLGWTSRA
jgi:hypothetical protein